MNNHKIVHKSLAILLLCFYFISTSGFIVYYHFCSEADQSFFSVYIDNTEEYCEQAHLANQDHSECSHCSEHGGCCQNHNTTTYAARLAISFDTPTKGATPTPIFTSLLFSAYTILNHTLFEENEPNTPTFNTADIPPRTYSGRELLIQHQSLKLDTKAFAFKG